jgi:hypothetical protein
MIKDSDCKFVIMNELFTKQYWSNIKQLTKNDMKKVLREFECKCKRTTKQTNTITDCFDCDQVRQHAEFYARFLFGLLDPNRQGYLTHEQFINNLIQLALRNALANYSIVFRSFAKYDKSSNPYKISCKMVEKCFLLLDGPNYKSVKKILNRKSWLNEEEFVRLCIAFEAQFLIGNFCNDSSLLLKKSKANSKKTCCFHMF